jgi:hypothetical protein
LHQLVGLRLDKRLLPGGPVATPEGRALVVLEECPPAELDAATRGRIQDELFMGWLADRLKEAALAPWAGGTAR